MLESPVLTAVRRLVFLQWDQGDNTKPRHVVRGKLGDKQMATGTVKWFNPTKGFGFIQPDQGGDDVFVHITAVQAAGLQGLDDNQKVSYELETGRNGKENATAIALA